MQATPQTFEGTAVQILGTKVWDKKLTGHGKKKKRYFAPNAMNKYHSIDCDLSRFLPVSAKFTQQKAQFRAY